MSYEVTIEPTGDVIEVEEGQTLLDAALRAGIYLPHACCHGLCATCKVEVLDGEIEQGDASPFALMDMERDEGKCLACCATPVSDLVIEADIEEDKDAEHYPVRDFVGVASKIEIFSPRIKGIFIAIENDGIQFQAGQYINLTIPGVDGPRAFSIASPPSEKNLVEINVCKINNGSATTWLHEKLKVNQNLTFSGPYGRFYVRDSHPEPMLFLAGGSGLSSPKSMIIDLFEHDETRDITLIYGARNQSELYYRDLFNELSDEHSNFHYIPVLSDEAEDSGWEGERGLVHEAAKRIFNGRFEGMKAYMCGPPPMVDACVSTLMQGRLFEKDMFLENFFDQSGKESKPSSPLFKSI
ncbi:MAG TPA: 2Fe-2S iron-sulfur cluster binding domain-containing protein [Gammaproteobacteria bacterium]|nr:2Fe-2S iron-sulfur cluster binding domain-containing protein [Gammaproteobacteria bacterium]